MQFEIASYLHTIILKDYKNIVKLILQVLTVPGSMIACIMTVKSLGPRPLSFTPSCFTDHAHSIFV